MKALIAAIALGCLASLPLQAQAQDLPKDIKDADKVVVAEPAELSRRWNSAIRRPTSSRASISTFRQALAKKLGIEIEWQEIGFEQMISSLTTGRVDLIHSGMSDLPKRRDRLDFVDYMNSGAQFYTSVAHKDDYKIAGRLLRQDGRHEPAHLVPGRGDEVERQELRGSRQAGAQHRRDRRLGRRQNPADAGPARRRRAGLRNPALPDQPVAGHLRHGREPFTAVYQGIGFSKNDTELRDAYVGALKDLISSGEYKAIFAKWGLGGTMVDQVMINNEPVK